MISGYPVHSAFDGK